MAKKCAYRIHNNTEQQQKICETYENLKRPQKNFLQQN